MLSPGALIADKYRVERLLGQGGMGAVYAATNVVLSKTVALKVMSTAFGADPQATERFFREATTASRVRHPAIVEIYDAGRTADGAPWMAMELLDGARASGSASSGSAACRSARCCRSSGPSSPRSTPSTRTGSSTAI